MGPPVIIGQGMGKNNSSGENYIMPLQLSVKVRKVELILINFILTNNS